MVTNPETTPAPRAKRTRAETLPYVSVRFERISTPRYGLAASPVAAVRLTDRTPEATETLSVENCARFPSQLCVISSHFEASKLSKSSFQTWTNGSVPVTTALEPPLALVPPTDAPPTARLAEVVLVPPTGAPPTIRLADVVPPVGLRPPIMEV